MQCKNHPEVEAIERCTGCAEPFCGDCLVDMHGQKYCGSCKVMALKGQPLVVEEATVPCKEANEALIYAIVGLFCFGIILEPVALSKAAKAKKMIQLNPSLQGSGKVTAATIIAAIGLVLWIIGLISRFSSISQRMQ
jgi:hypothetical protein